MTRTSVLRLPGDVRLEYLKSGTGQPVTLFVPGLGGGIPDTRVLASGVPGTRVFIRLRGHGRATAPGDRWRYADLAADVAGAADAVGADRAFGVSMGAGALCRLAADVPDRFDRLVFFLPAVLDEPRPGPARARIRALSAALAAGSPEAVARLLSDEVPEPFRDTAAARSYLAQRAATLLDGGLASPVASLADQVAVEDVAALSRVSAPVLVLAARGDELHPVEVAERLASVLPRASLHVYDEPGVLWTARADLRSRISGFLAA